MPDDDMKQQLRYLVNSINVVENAETSPERILAVGDGLAYRILQAVRGLAESTGGESLKACETAVALGILSTIGRSVREHRASWLFDEEVS